MAEDANAAIAVMGDFNDGPGMDYFEQYYLAHNVTDIVVGSSSEPENIFVHAQHDVAKDQRYTAVFDDFVKRSRKSICSSVSPGMKSGAALHKVPGSGKIHHKESQDQVVNNGLQGEDRPSDHHPVSVQLAY